MFVDKLFAEQDAAHGNRILGALLRGDRAHIGLVGIAHVGIHHVQVPLVHRHIGGLAHRAAAVVQPGAAVGQLDEVLKIFQGPVAPPFIQIHHKG